MSDWSEDRPASYYSVKDFTTEYLLSECREQMESSADRGCYADELGKRIEALQELFDAVRSQWTDTEDGALHEYDVDDEGNVVDGMVIRMGKDEYQRIEAALIALGHEMD